MLNRKSILAILACHVQCAPKSLSVDDVLTDIGIDSLKFIAVVLEIEQFAKRKVFSIDNIGSLVTVGDMLAIAEQSYATGSAQE